MKTGMVTKSRHLWVYPFIILIVWPALIFAEIPATSINDQKITNPTESDASHRGRISELESENSPADLHGEWANEELEYGEPEDNAEDSYTVVENDDGERFLVFHPTEKRALRSGFANMLRLDKKANYNPSFNSMLRLDKKAYDPSLMLRLDKKAIKTHHNFANMLRLDKRAPYMDNFLRLDKKFANLLRLDKKSNYNPSSFNSMLRLDKKSPMRNSNFANMLRLDKKANYNHGFNSMLRLDKKANYNHGFNSMLRLDKKFSPNNYNAFSNQLRLDKKSFKSSLRNFGLLRLD